MANYTYSVREILQANKTPSENLTSIADVYAIANRSLFDIDGINAISSEYREQLITGFALHFMNEELAYETIPLWKIALNEKLYNSGSYIDEIFANLDKQVFANYRVRNVENEGTTSDQKRATGTISNEREDNTTTTTQDDATHSETVENSQSGTVTGTGTVANAKTGTDTMLRTGTDTHAKSGTDTLTKTGTDTDAKTGSDTVEKTGTDATAHTGTQGVSSSSDQETNNTGHTDTDHNVVQVNSDTPMGSLSNLRTPGGAAKGTGVNYANSQTYNYMSSASEVDESNVQTDATTQTVESSESSTTTFNDTNTETRNLTDETTYDSRNTKTLNLTDTNSYGSSDTETRNMSDAQSYGSTNTETRNTTDTTEKTDSTERTGADNKTVETVVDGTVTDTETRNTTDSSTGSHADSTDEVEYTLNWEMLYKSMPLLNKVWEVFDDLFMIIF